MERQQSTDVLNRFRNVAVIGAGVIGASWTALFLAHGLNVVVSDPREDAEAEVRDELAKVGPTLDSLGLPNTGLEVVCASKLIPHERWTGSMSCKRTAPNVYPSNRSFGRK